MIERKNLDCVVIGYNEAPFEQYEKLLRNYGEDSEAYRDLKFSFVDVGGKKLNYVDLLNHVLALADGHEGANGKHRFESGDIPNLAAVYLTNYLRRRGHDAAFINLFQREKEQLSEYLAQNPLCVAITTTFYVLNFPVNEMVEFIREHNSEVKIVVGGPLIANHLRNYREDKLTTALDDLGADIYVTDSQGELTLTQIIECLKNGGDIRDVPNLIYSENGKFQRTRVVTENNSLDENYINWRGFPDCDLGHTLQTRTARSCAFKCSFCNYPGRAGALTLAGLDTLEKEFDSMRELGVRNVVFIDDTFNVPLPRFKDICRLMIKKDYRFNWFSYFRCSNSDQEAFDLMAESGCRGVFLGIESGSPAILKNMNKAATVEKYATGIERLHQHGILTFGSFIIGFPGETDATVKETVDFIKATKPTYYRAQMWYNEPGTPIHNEAQKYNITGEGFVWNHLTMDSLEAMDHIDRMFLEIDSSVWLPQWSFDFWVIPYLLGKGISFDNFRDFMTIAHKLLRLEIASVPAHQKSIMQQDYLRHAVKVVRDWNLTL
jgi:p-methyltransferase